MNKKTNLLLCGLFFWTGLCLAVPDLIVTDVWDEGSVIWYQIRNVGTTKFTASFVNTLHVDGSLQGIDYVTATVPTGGRLTRYFDKYGWQCSAVADQIQVVADADDDIVATIQGSIEAGIGPATHDHRAPHGELPEQLPVFRDVPGNASVVPDQPVFGHGNDDIQCRFEHDRPVLSKNSIKISCPIISGKSVAFEIYLRAND